MTIPRMPEEKLPRIRSEELMEQMERLAEHYGYPGTPRNETSFSPTYIADWWEMFKPYTYKQIKKAVAAHIDADDSLKGVFPLPGRIKKFIKQDEDEYRMICENYDRIEAERKREAEQKEKERWESLTEEERQAELKQKEEWNKKFKEMLAEKGISYD